jgi:uncharacterized protein YciI
VSRAAADRQPKELSIVSYYAVIRTAGPAWTDGKGVFEQAGVNDHAVFMNTLAEEGVILFAGPLAGSEHGRIRVLLIADAPSEADIRRLVDDPWELAQQIATTSVEPWNLFVGAQRLTHAQAATAAS